jgi:hypothetical protein
MKYVTWVMMQILAYADNVVLISRSVKDLKTAYQQIEEEIMWN